MKVGKRKKAPPKRPEGGAGHRPLSQRKVDQVEVVNLTRRGWSQMMIAEKLGVSQPIVSITLKAAYAEAAKSQHQDIDVLREQKLDQLAYLYREAVEAWHRSKEDAEKVVEEEGSTDIRGGHNKKITTREGRLPDPRYLAVAENCIKQERDLRGLNPPKEVNIKAQVDVWGVLSGAAVERPKLTVEEEMEQLLLQHNASRGEVIEGKVESVKEVRGEV